MATKNFPMLSTRPSSDFPCREVSKMEIHVSNDHDWHNSDHKNEFINEQEIGREIKFSISQQDILVLLAMASLSLMAALDGTSISVALPVK